MQFDLTELKPKETSLELDAFPGKVFTIGLFNLRERIWAQNKFGKNEFADAIKKGDLVVISEIVHRLIKDKVTFPSFDDFSEKVASFSDLKKITDCFYLSMGIAESPVNFTVEVADGGKPEALPK